MFLLLYDYTILHFPSILRYALCATQDERKFITLHINSEVLHIRSFSQVCELKDRHAGFARSIRDNR